MSGSVMPLRPHWPDSSDSPAPKRATDPPLGRGLARQRHQRGREGAAQAVVAHRRSSAPALPRDLQTAAVRMGHLALKRAIRHAAARRYVTMNAAELADTPVGQFGRPSKSLTLEQSVVLLKVSAGTRIGAYIAVSLGTGIRTEEARALRPGRWPGRVGSTGSGKSGCLNVIMANLTARLSDTMGSQYWREGAFVQVIWHV